MHNIEHSTKEIIISHLLASPERVDSNDGEGDNEDISRCRMFSCSYK